PLAGERVGQGRGVPGQEQAAGETAADAREGPGTENRDGIAVARPGESAPAGREVAVEQGVQERAGDAGGERPRGVGDPHRGAAGPGTYREGGEGKAGEGEDQRAPGGPGERAPRPPALANAAKTNTPAPPPRQAARAVRPDPPVVLPDRAGDPADTDP